MKAYSLAAVTLLTAGFAAETPAQDLKLLFGGLRDEGQEIRILDALYGQDQQVCRAYEVVAQLCDGRDYCEVQADGRLCGDPYANVRKQLFIGFECGDGRRSITVDEGETARLYCLGAQRSGGGQDNPTYDQPGGGAPSGWQRGALYIESVHYGASGRTCDATPAFYNACNGRSQCQLTVNNKLCGDPARGTGKVATVRYWCNGQFREETVKERKTARLGC